MENITCDPCSVCGGTDLNLVDGFYYCVECGTQDATARQTVVEDRALADGTLAMKYRRKFRKRVEEQTIMSGEWYKWHAFNYILVGLADELIAAGAKPSFKDKLLYLWTEYIKKYQDKNELGISGDCSETIKPKKRKAKVSRGAGELCKDVITSMLYMALNLDGSEIQLSDIRRFMKEGHLDIHNCAKYVPKEIRVDLIPDWTVFERNKCSLDVDLYTVSLLNALEISPRMPDVRMLVDRYTKELCLPKDFKDLVLALMHHIPLTSMELDKYCMKNLKRFPLYECTVMTYFLIAFKMCFGLDDDYEVALSDAVDKINSDNCHMKSYKLGSYSETTDRLFSFREWCTFIQLRKIVLCKCYLHMAEEFTFDIDDYVYMEHFKGRRNQRAGNLSEDIMMGFLDKMTLIGEVEVIPKSEFKPTTTPFTTYTELISQYFNDPDLKLMFCEDFSQYSLDYVYKKLHLQDIDTNKNIVVGVNKSNKLILKTKAVGNMGGDKGLDVDMVYVRNCDNKNWARTKQPSVEHIQKVNEDERSSSKSDNGYESNPEIALNDTETNMNEESCIITADEIKDENKLLIKKESDDLHIFDDDFSDLRLEVKEEVEEHKVKEEQIIEENEPHDDYHFTDDYGDIYDANDSQEQQSDDDFEAKFNPETFNRNKTIKELILATCKKFKIRVPSEFKPKEPINRKRKFIDDQTGESIPKKQKRKAPNDQMKSKTKKVSVQDEINNILNAYFKNVENDILLQISEQVKSIVNNTMDTSNINNTLETTNGNIGNETSEFAIDQEIRSQPLDCADANDINEEPESGAIDNINVIETLTDTTEQSTSVQCIDESVLSNIEPECDPKFDENKYNTDQLFVNVQEVVESVDDFDIADDPEIIDIIDRKLNESTNKKKPVPYRSKNDFTHLDDNCSLAELKNRLQITKHWNLLKQKKYVPLTETKHIEEYNYWDREYLCTSLLFRSKDLNEAFHKELNDHFPKSFYFVIKECAAIIRCTPFVLYKSLMFTERRLL